jgi:hypothetical protein
MLELKKWSVLGHSFRAALLRGSKVALFRYLCQCRKWRMPVKTMAIPSLSAAAITS